MIRLVQHAGSGVIYPHVRDWLARLFRNDPTWRVLEAGAGAGQYAALFPPASYRSFDIPESWYEVVRRPDVYASADRLPFSDKAFDLVFSVAAFDYFPAPAQVLAEFSRCLRPGGSVVLFTYNRATLEQIHRNCEALPAGRATAGHHVFDARVLRALAAPAGLRVKRLPLAPRMGVVERLKLTLRPSNFRNYELHSADDTARA